MGNPRRISDAVRQAVVADARATVGTDEGSTREIAARHGVSEASVRRFVREAPDAPQFGDPATRASLQNAIEASQLDMAARRAALAERSLRLAESVMDDLESRHWKIYNFGGKDNTLAMAEVDFVPPSDKRNLIITFGTALDKHKMLDNYDSDVRDKDALTAWLEHMTGRNDA